MGTGDPERGAIQSVATAVELLQAIYDREEAGVTELAADLDRSKSTIHHYLKTLEQCDCLENDGGRYRLGLKLLTFGGQARSRERLYRLARRDVDQLAEETGEEARLVVERNGDAITLYQARGERAERSSTHVGSVEDLHCTAAGKAFLAALPDDRASAVLERLELTAYTDRTITDRAVLEAELEEIRARDVAFDDEERFEGVRCVASSIATPAGDVLGAISVSGPTDRFEDERFRRTLPDRVRTIVGVVEVNTTYSGWAGDGT